MPRRIPIDNLGGEREGRAREERRGAKSEKIGERNEEIGVRKVARMSEKECAKCHGRAKRSAQFGADERKIVCKVARMSEKEYAMCSVRGKRKTGEKFAGADSQ